LINDFSITTVRAEFPKHHYERLVLHPVARVFALYNEIRLEEGNAYRTT
jgi:hypothetical protein